jgi:hypothetical protein
LTYETSQEWGKDAIWTLDYRLKHDYAGFTETPTRTGARLGKQTVVKDGEVVVEEIDPRQVTSEDQ